jgi:hypothetical protein
MELRWGTFGLLPSFSRFMSSVGSRLRCIQWPSGQTQRLAADGLPSADFRSPRLGHRRRSSEVIHPVLDDRVAGERMAA